MADWKSYLEGGDLRSISGVDDLVPLIQKQADFDELFSYLYSEERLIIMRAVDAIEKISLERSEFLEKHKKDILQFLSSAKDKEFKWHLAQIISRIELASDEFSDVWKILSNWALNPKESKIVRVNSIQSLFDLMRKYSRNKKEFQDILDQVRAENIPSINARLRKLNFNSLH